MADDPTDSLAQTCRCGGSISVTSPDPERVDRRVREWRETHACVTPAEAGERGGGGGCAQAERAPTGFVGGGHPRLPGGGVS